MYLSNFQKKIIRKISTGEIKTILDFLTEFEIVFSEVDGRPVLRERADFFFDDVQYKLYDKEEAYNALIDFKKVINLLTKAELIEIEESAALNFGYAGTPERPVQIIAIINSFRTNLIIPYNEIRKFEKDFLTPQERNQKRQLWVPIIVAITTVILSSVLNYFIYTKEREVYIKNVNAFKDSLYVKILDDIDSSLAKKNTVIDSLNPKNQQVSPVKKLKEQK